MGVLWRVVELQMDVSGAAFAGQRTAARSAGSLSPERSSSAHLISNTIYRFPTVSHASYMLAH